MMSQIEVILATLSGLDVIDIIIVAFVLYRLYYMIRDTRAAALVKGLMLLLLATAGSKWLGLNVG